MTNYGLIDAVNFSTLKYIAISPAHYMHNLSSKRDTASMKIGRVVHMAILEPQKLASLTAQWIGGIKRGHKWEQFMEDNPGKEILTENEWDTIQEIRKSVLSSSSAAKYLAKGKAEVAITWNIGDIKCKGRIDFDSEHAIVDLKTTHSASPELFGREVWRYRYHTQGAWYTDGYEKSRGKRKPYVFIAVESKPPYVVQAYTVPDQVIDAGREDYSNMLDRLLECRASGKWPGYCDSELELSLPRWAINSSVEDDISGLDLNIGE